MIDKTNETISKWLTRLENELELSKFFQISEIAMTFTRNEIIELKLLLSTLKEIAEKDRNDEKQG